MEGVGAGDIGVEGVVAAFSLRSLMLERRLMRCKGGQLGGQPVLVKNSRPSLEGTASLARITRALVTQLFAISLKEGYTACKLGRIDIYLHRLTHLVKEEVRTVSRNLCVLYETVTHLHVA